MLAGHSVTLADCPRIFPRGPGDGGSLRQAVMSGEARLFLTVQPEGLTVQPGSILCGSVAGVKYPSGLVFNGRLES